MTDQANLERAYRRLLACYPKAFRQEKGREILAVLMDCSPEGQRRPRLADSMHLVASGLWMRLHPAMPPSARTVRAAVRVMYAGAVVTTVTLFLTIISLAHVGRGAATLRLAGRNQSLPVATTVGIMDGLVIITLWLWMAHENGQGRNWARIVATVLFGLATPHLFGNKGVIEVVFAVLTWVIGLAAVWLLWRPESGAFFKPKAEQDALSASADC